MDILSFKKPKHIFFLILVVSLALHLLSIFLGSTIFANWKWAHEPSHTALEITGTLISLLVAKILIFQEKMQKGTSFNIWIAGALVGMGVLDGFHALCNVGNNFVWLHSISTFVGGVLFASVFFGQTLQQKVKPFWVPSIFIICVLLGVLTLLFPQFFPNMLNQGLFTPTAKFLNLAGGGLLLFSSVKIFLVYRKTKNFDDILFFLHALLFGLAAIMFQQSKLWDFPWWSWHILRFLAYVAALAFSIRSQRLLENEMFETSVNARSQNLYERMDFALDAANIGVWDWDVINNDLVWDKRMYKLYGVKEKNFSKAYEAWAQALHPDDKERAQREINRAVEKKQNFSSIFRVVLPSGKIRVIQAEAKLFLKNDKPTKMIGINYDITKIQEQKVKLIQTNHELTQFAYICSHDLQEPVRTISYLIGKTLHKDKNLSQESVLTLKKVESYAQRMQNMVSDILSFSRIGREKIEFSEFSSQNTAEEVISEFENKIDQTQISIKTSQKLPTLNSNETLFRQILQNLVSNALKFRKKDQNTLVEIDVTDTGDFWQFYVKDNGIGIETEHYEKVFGLFQRIHSQNEYPGTGIGLGTCKKFIELLNGKLWFESTPNIGSIFFFTIPK